MAATRSSSSGSFKWLWMWSTTLFIRAAYSLRVDSDPSTVIHAHYQLRWITQSELVLILINWPCHANPSEVGTNENRERLVGDSYIDPKRVSRRFGPQRRYGRHLSITAFPSSHDRKE